MTVTNVTETDRQQEKSDHEYVQRMGKTSWSDSGLFKVLFYIL